MIVAVLGAYGRVGQNICRMLLKLTGIKIKALGRREEEAKKNLADIWDRIYYENVDVTDEKGFENFLKDIVILINVAGIKGRKEVKLINLCCKANVRYISSGKINPYNNRKNCIFDVGSMPGLSLLIPRAMAENMKEPIEEVNFYYCVQDSFSRNAAKDYIEGLFDDQKKMMVTYEDGKLIPFSEDKNFEIPYLKGQKRRYPFFDRESEFLTEDLKLKKGSWSMVLEGERTIKALEECRIIYQDNQELAIEKLCRASGLDTFEHGRYSGIYVRMKTENNESHFFIKCNTSSELTALASVLCVVLIQRYQSEHFYGSFGEFKDTTVILRLLQELADEVIWESDKKEITELLVGEI